ncbi:MAG: HincII family type II restriction endonuclease [Prevotella sp.]|nr:HincII family type II restriction endonuclease [Prevotella sp.]
MHRIDFGKIIELLPGQQVERPNRADGGTLSGHAAGEPFEKKVYQDLKALYPGKIFKQYEFLNDIFLKNPLVITKKDRCALMNSPTAMFLLCRGKTATENWSPENLFEEKQNDTADILYYIPGFYGLIDVKTRNLNKKAQAPNIISAYKLEGMCALMIDNDEYDSVGLDYVGIGWVEEAEKGMLICKNAHHVDMFKHKPDDLYINWSAGLQIQFKPEQADQSWTGNKKDWVKAYLTHYVLSAKDRHNYFEAKFITPFLKYL